MILGIIAAVIVLIEVCMFFLKHLKFVKKAVYNGSKAKALLTLHKILGIVLLLVILTHLILTWTLMQQRPILTFITGFIMAACILTALLSFLFRAKWSRWRLVHQLASAFLIVILVVHIFSVIISYNQYVMKIQSIEIESMTADGIPDGSYIGDYDAGYIYAKVQVDVVNEQITEVIILEHRNERGESAGTIVEQMVINQNLQVDAISGATNSSLVIMKAAENALIIAGEN